jgi:4-carboxymuconolactone decarboxylase
MADDTAPSGAQRMLGDFAPALVDYTDTVLFGQVWQRPELSPRDRSLITVAALLAGGNTEQLTFHLTYANRTVSPRPNSSRPSPTWPSTPVGPRPCPR